jgi:hypothetical protein
MSSTNTPLEIPIKILIDGIVTNDQQLLDTLHAIDNSSQTTQQRLAALTTNFNTVKNSILGNTRWAPTLMLMGG